MGNSCQMDECLQPTNPRDSLRRKSLSNIPQNLTLKNLIQIKNGMITDEYVLNELIGQGTYGNVYRSTHKLSKVIRAAKRIEKRKRSIEAVQEWLILKRLDHPNIIRIYDIYYEKKYIYIVMDYCEGGQLFERIVKEEGLTQSDAGCYMKQLLSAIQHCHAHQVMHRDLKPENIMFLSSKQSTLKIIDFGVGTSFREDRKATLKVGSLYYIAPEVIKKHYDEKCDVWSLGIILYIMITGAPPFKAATDQQVYDLILKGEVPFPEARWGSVSRSVKDLVEKMLKYHPIQRISAKEALNHPWIKMSHELRKEKLLVGEGVESMRTFCKMNQFQSSIMAYISHNLVQNQALRELEERFRRMDRNGDGQISWQEFRECYGECMGQGEEEARGMFARLDRNHSNFIDYSEFITCSIDKAYLSSENLVNRAFEMIDRDKDGYLSKQELMAAFGGCNYDVYAQILKDFDLNNDGHISKHEFKLAMKGLLTK